MEYWNGEFGPTKKIKDDFFGSYYPSLHAANIIQLPLKIL
jgi:hypothetical protein